MVLPAGSSIPPLPYLLVLVAGVTIVGGLLRRARPALTEPAVLALTPWMAVGAALHVGYVRGIVPPTVAPLLGSPAVYVTTAILAGGTWLVGDAAGVDTVHVLGLSGSGLLIIAVGAVLGLAGVSRLAVPVAALLVGLFLGVAAWVALRRTRPAAVATTGRVGLLVLFAHAIDGVSTAVGVDVLGFSERTPASRVIIDLAAGMPTAEVIGVGWLFVIVKLAVAAGVVVLFADYLREEPTTGYALLGLIAAVGLGPGVHNLLLYAVA